MRIGNRAIIGIIGFVIGSCGLILARATAAETPPNVIIILSDDLGYGDSACYGAKGIKTPNIDKLAANGLRFTDAHSTASTCTPSRYSIMTGQYAWRKKGTGILPGDAAIIIPPGSTTIGAVFQKAGYVTGAVGKWHLGLGNGDIDWNGSISPGPNEVGFSWSFIMPATGDRVPCVYIENHNIVGLDPKDPIRVSYKQKVGDEPTGRENPDQLKMKLSKGHDGTIVDGISRIGWMSGGHAARWIDEEMAPTLTAKATGFIEQNKDHPFFLYFAPHDIHVPHAPDKEFAGSSPFGPRGDTIQQLDWSVGQVVATLERLNLSNKTLIVFSSDNGPVVDDGYADGSLEKLASHTPAGPLRGGKYTIYEGGTRMPFITVWPGHIKPGISSALVCQVDFLASFAGMLSQPLPADAAPDSFNVLPALLGQSEKGRDELVEQSEGIIALRKGDWKFVSNIRRAANRAGAAAGKFELYDLSKDIGEKKNLAEADPQRVSEMNAELEKIRAARGTRN